MKKTKLTFIILIAITTFSNLSAQQIEKGKFVVGGTSKLQMGVFNSAFDNNNGFKYDEKRRVLNLEPTLGYAIVPRLISGLSFPLRYEYLSHTGSGGGPTILEFTNFKYSIAPYLRYYFFTYKSIQLFTNGSFNIGKETIDYHSDGLGGSFNNFYGFDLGVGISLFFLEGVAVDFGISYESLLVDRKGQLNSSEKLKGLNVDLGLIVLF